MSIRVKMMLSGLSGLILGAAISAYGTMKFMGWFAGFNFLLFEGYHSIVLVNALNNLQDAKNESAVEILEQELGANMLSISLGMKEFPKGVESVDKVVPMVKDYWSRYPYSYDNDEVDEIVTNYINSKK